MTEEELKKYKQEMRKKNPSLVMTDSVDEALNLLADEYTLSFKNVCQLLMSSRSWVSKFIKPHVKYLFIKPYSILRCPGWKENWNPQKDCIYFSRKNFEEVFFSGVQNVTRQAISIPYEYLIDPKKDDEVFALLKNANKKIRYLIKEKEAGNITAEQYVSLLDQIELDCYAAIVGDCLILDIDKKDKKQNTQRTKCPTTSVELPEDFSFDELETVHDIKDYGDTDEMVYRQLFDESAYRFELVLPDSNGVPSKKIFYYPSNRNGEEFKKIRCKPFVPPKEMHGFWDIWLKPVCVSYEFYISKFI